MKGSGCRHLAGDDSPRRGEDGSRFETNAGSVQFHCRGFVSGLGKAHDSRRLSLSVAADGSRSFQAVELAQRSTIHAG